MAIKVKREELQLEEELNNALNELGIEIELPGDEEFSFLIDNSDKNVIETDNE